MEFDNAYYVRIEVQSYLIPNPRGRRMISPIIGLRGIAPDKRKVIQQLQACIELAHHSQRFNLYLTHNVSDQQLVDDEEQIVWHEPILDEYWDQLEEENRSQEEATGNSNRN